MSKVTINPSAVFRQFGSQWAKSKCFECDSIRLIPVLLYRLPEYKNFVVHCHKCGAEMGPGAKSKSPYSPSSSWLAVPKGTYGKKVSPGPNCYGHMF